ncbi:hypothetical protein FDP41_011322 [Naegleria fowleri]|uniref:EGF-like domain-containing protein n=1 Tax=Naegleria fowleri TaxID=5763 RepID=A0A6A5C6C7_NAEFO|nr:uncharacterized protein FDP41_011322 [Naegleria fowleri]KAF0982392.1 hypothetical protein FDP41_011322 [Naegleria fowleri]CAG4708320.1 unnamed protein product [Naegleria fowleri]
MVHLCTTAVVDVKHNITTFAGNGNPTFSGDGVSATSSGMKPFNCQVLPSGDVIFADFDNHRVRKIDSQTGLMSTIAGTGSTNYNGDNQLATSANLNHPIGIFVSLSGSIYIAEYGNHRIRKIETNGLISTIAGTGVAGSSGDYGPAISAQINSPICVYEHSNGEVYLCDSFSHKIRKIFTNGTIVTIAGTGIGGALGDGGLATDAQLYQPSQVYVNASGDILIMDRLNHRLRHIDTQGIISTIAGTTQGYSGDNGLATNAQLSIPTGFFLAPIGDIFIADYSNGRIRRVDSQGIISTVAGSGSSGFSGDGSSSLDAMLYDPSSVFVTTSGEIYFTDFNNNRIRKLNPYCDNNGYIFDSNSMKCVPICYGQTLNNACGGPQQGLCIAPNQCQCTNSYTGPTCSTPICFGIDATDTTHVCSGRGTCVNPNQCQCSPHYYGSHCEVTTCFGIFSNNTQSVCSSRGTCIDYNTCQCNPNYFSSQCEVSKCFGFFSNSSNVCSSHGTCLDTNLCKCDTNYFGDQCEATTCNGVFSNTSLVCSYNNGTCSSFNNCTCHSGYTGNNCEIPLCFGIQSDAPSLVCSAHGSCVRKDTCQCVEDWRGANCSIPLCFKIPATDFQVCSSRGPCISNNTCLCDAMKYDGQECQFYKCYGISSNSSNVCSGNGECINVDKCKCKSGYGGDKCQYSSCYGILSNFTSEVCSGGRGRCNSLDNCTCYFGYHGDECQFTKCGGIDSNSNLTCNFGNGTCVDYNTCKCNSLYFGNNCQFPSCYGYLSNDSKVCRGKRGSCLLPDTCQCNPHYFGNQCEFTTCFGINSENNTVCNGNGICLDFNTCDCHNGWTGPECKETYCFGRLSNSTFEVCSGHGNCTAHNQCECNDKFYGKDCSIHSCFGISATNSSVCNENGLCVALDICSCLNDTIHYDCSLLFLRNERLVLGFSSVQAFIGETDNVTSQLTILDSRFLRYYAGRDIKIVWEIVMDGISLIYRIEKFIAFLSSASNMAISTSLPSAIAQTGNVTAFASLFDVKTQLAISERISSRQNLRVMNVPPQDPNESSLIIGIAVGVGAPLFAVGSAALIVTSVVAVVLKKKAVAAATAKKIDVARHVDVEIEQGF